MHFFFKKMSQPPADFDEGVVPMETEPFTPLKPQQECKAILSYKQIAGRRDFGCQVPQSKQSARVKYKKFRVSNRNVAGHVISYFGHHDIQIKRFKLGMKCRAPLPQSSVRQQQPPGVRTQGRQPRPQFMQQICHVPSSANLPRTHSN